MNHALSFWFKTQQIKWLVQKDFPVIIPKTILIIQLVKTTRRLYDQHYPRVTTETGPKRQGVSQQLSPFTYIEASWLV